MSSLHIINTDIHYKTDETSSYTRKCRLQHAWWYFTKIKLVNAWIPWTKEQIQNTYLAWVLWLLCDIHPRINLVDISIYLSEPTQCWLFYLECYLHSVLDRDLACCQFPWRTTLSDGFLGSWELDSTRFSQTCSPICSYSENRVPAESNSLSTFSETKFETWSRFHPHFRSILSLLSKIK